MAMEFSIHCRNFGLHAPFLFASATPVLHEGKRTEVLVIPTCAGMTVREVIAIPRSSDSPCTTAPATKNGPQSRGMQHSFLMRRTLSPFHRQSPAVHMSVP